jgi:hypothetical protein
MEKLDRILFIVPYFGSLPNYFQLWLRSCGYNSTINWLLLIDDKSNFCYPANVVVKYCSFDDIRRKFIEKFGDSIVLDKPYQICEFRPSFGYVFKEFVEDFEFWGYCDVDLIWGNLRNFLTPQILKENDKIGWRGHMTLIKNNVENNSIFFSEFDGVNWWKIISENSTKFPLAFDEGGISLFFEKRKKKTFSDFPFADLKIRSSNFQCLHTNEKFQNSRQVQMLFHWKGELIRYSLVGEDIHSNEYAYVHFLKRPMKVDGQEKHLHTLDSFWIVPNSFLFIKDLSLSKNNFQRYRKYVYWEYFINRISINYLVEKYRYFKSKQRFRKRYGSIDLKSPDYSINLKSRR